MTKEFENHDERAKVALFRYIYAIGEKNWSTNTDSEWNQFFGCIKKFADEGFGLAQYLVSRIYADINRDLYDKEKHMHYLIRSAENGVLNAHLDISLMYDEEKDLKELEIIENKLNKYNISIVSIRLGNYFFFSDNIDKEIRLKNSLKYYRNSIISGFNLPIRYYILLLNIYVHSDTKGYFLEVRNFCERIKSLSKFNCLKRIAISDDDKVYNNLIGLVTDNYNKTIRNNKICNINNLHGMECLFEINLRKIMCNFLYETNNNEVISIEFIDDLDRDKPCGLNYSFSRQYNLGLKKFYEQ